MANGEREKLTIGKQIPVIRVVAILLEDRYSFQVLTRGQINEDPFSLPPIRDVFMPPDKPGLEFDYETIRFSPIDGGVFVLGQRNEQSKIVIDNLDPKKESFWLSYSQLDDAYSASKKFYLDQGKSAIANNTEDIIFSIIDNFPQFFDGKLGDKAVEKIINDICANLVTKGQITEAENNQKYVDYVLHRIRGMYTSNYSEQQKRSQIGTAVLNVISDLIEERGTTKNYSPALASLLVEHQIEQRFLKNLKKDFASSMLSQLQPDYNNLQGLKKSFLEYIDKYFKYPIFRCAPIKQSAEEIHKTLFKINKIIDDFSHWNADYTVKNVRNLIK